MKVLHFYKTFSPDQHGGVENFIRHLCHATTKHGCENTILSLAKEPLSELKTDTYRLIQVREDLKIAATGFSMASIPAFFRLAAEADIIHYHFPWPFMDFVHFLARPGKPSVVTYHSDIVRQKVLLQFYRPVMNAFLGSVSKIVATSPNYTESSPVLRRFSSKTCVIPIGLDENLYPKPDAIEVERLRGRFGPRFFLFIGVLRYYKGLHILLDALKGTDIPVVIAGAGPVEQELKAHAERLELTGAHFLGPVSEQQKVDLIEASTALVFPSHLRSEAFGISLLEAAMMGKPMICTEIGTGTSFVNISGETGFVVPPGNPEALQAALKSLWRDDSLCKAFGEAARMRFDTVFTNDIMGKAYKDLYVELGLRG